ncbi:MAG: hypothetical protein KAJ07_13375, partial [Planctomycetes bacterium]|nr:hypothetical protein [Planctomycetota bacterium]
MFKKLFVILFVIIISGVVSGLVPNQILIIANEDIPESISIAEYYCDKRHVPRENILKLKLGKKLSDTIKRDAYNELLAKPIRQRVDRQKITTPIRCLLTVYGVPYKVGSRGLMPGQQENLKKLTLFANDKCKQLKDVFGELETLSKADSQTKGVFDLPSSLKLLKKMKARFQDVLKDVIAIDDEGKKQAALNEWLIAYGKVNGKGLAFKRGEEMAGVYRPLTTDEKLIAQLSYSFFNRVKKENWDYTRKLKEGFYERLDFSAGINGVLLRIDADISNIKGVETNASVDSELSMVMFD